MQLTRKQFSEISGVNSDKLCVYIRRGKLVMSGKLIDTSIKQNAEFLAKWQLKNDIKSKNPLALAVKIPTDQLELTEPKDDSLNISDSLSESSSEDALTRANKYAQLKSKEIEIRLKLIDEEKKRGELVPTEHVKSIIGTQARAITTAFKDALELLIVRISAKKQLTLDETASVRGEMVEVLNGAIDAAVNESKKTLSKIIKEFSETKSVGEHA
jgi:hypothetical protein